MFRSTLALVIGFSVVAGAAYARPSDSTVEVVSQTVHFADLDISTRKGAKNLAERIHAAAGSVCEDTVSRYAVNYRGCVQETDARAVDRVGSPLVARSLGLQRSYAADAHR